MKRAAVCLVLLFCLQWTWAQGEGDQSSSTANIWAELKELRDMVTQQKVELRSSRSKIQKLEQDNTDLLARVTASENKNTEVPKVAFSVGLTDEGSVGPWAYDEMMIFSKVFTNIGQAYNSTTGFFTAPARGVYYFRFTGWSSYRSANIAISLYHNDIRISRNEDKNDDVGFVTVHNAFVLQLEQKDVVYMVQNGGRPLYDDWFNRTTFSGFLLFAL